MIDEDDVFDSALWGGVGVAIVLLIIYLIFSRPVIDKCKSKGGVMVKANGYYVCVDAKEFSQLKERAKP